MFNHFHKQKSRYEGVGVKFHISLCSTVVVIWLLVWLVEVRTFLRMQSAFKKREIESRPGQRAGQVLLSW